MYHYNKFPINSFSNTESISDLEEILITPVYFLCLHCIPETMEQKEEPL